VSAVGSAASRWREAYLGKTRRFDVGLIDALWSQRYAVAVDDLDPLYFDDQYARTHGYAGLVVPPNYLATKRVAAMAGPTEGEMQGDGLPVPGPSNTPELAAMGGGQELVFHNPVYCGEFIRGEATVIRADERDGRAGPMLIVEEEINYRADTGELKLTLVQTTLYRVPPQASPNDDN